MLAVFFQRPISLINYLWIGSSSATSRLITRFVILGILHDPCDSILFTGKMRLIIPVPIIPQWLDRFSLVKVHGGTECFSASSSGSQQGCPIYLANYAPPWRREHMSECVRDQASHSGRHEQALCASDQVGCLWPWGPRRGDTMLL